MKYWDEQRRLYPKWAAKREHYAKLLAENTIRPKAKDVLECIAFSLAGSALGFGILALVAWIVV